MRFAERAYHCGAGVTVMADESKVLPSVAELEELHDVEELKDDDATGEFSRPRSHAAPARHSVPPPVPKEAREVRRSSFVPGSMPPRRPLRVLSTRLPARACSASTPRSARSR